MNRKIAVDTSVFEKIADGDLGALSKENDRYRRAVVENDAASKLDNQDERPHQNGTSSDKAAPER